MAAEFNVFAALEAGFAPTPDAVARRMLRIARLRDGDAFYDLGSGDGAVLIMAATEFGARAVGVEIQRKLVTYSRRRIQALAMDALVPVQDASSSSAWGYTDDGWLRDAVDIDPTMLLKHQDSEDQTTWWSPIDRPQAPGLDDSAWLAPTGPVPEVRRLAEVTDPDGVTWLALQFGRQWGSLPYPAKDETRRLWMAGRCYLVRRSVAAQAEEEVFDGTTLDLNLFHTLLYNYTEYRSPGKLIKQIP